MGDKRHYLGEFEELVLLAIIRLGANAYGVPIREAVEEATGRLVSVGALYTTFDRLEQKGFIRSWQGEPIPERGGRSKRYFEVNATGVQALNDVEQARSALRGRLQPAGGSI